jgi:hypothetical protein
MMDERKGIEAIKKGGVGSSQLEGSRHLKVGASYEAPPAASSIDVRTDAIHSESLHACYSTKLILITASDPRQDCSFRKLTHLGRPENHRLARMSKVALVIVDVQNDFLPHGSDRSEGSLAVPDGDAVIPIIEGLLAKGPHGGWGWDLVVATQVGI